MNDEQHSEWEVQGLYGSTWEMVTTCASRLEAMAMRRTYLENERGTRFRVVRSTAS